MTPGPQVTETLVRVFEGQVPPEIRALTHTSRPLPTDVVFVPTLCDPDTGGSDYVELAGRISVGMFFGIYVLLTLRWFGAGATGPSLMKIQGLLAYPLGWAFFRAFWGARVARRQPEGRRRGVFKLSRGVAVFDGARYTLLPDGAGTRYEFRSPARNLRGTWFLDITTSDGAVQTCEVDAAQATIERGRTLFGG